MDVLAEVIRVAQVRGAVAARLDAAEPWGLQLDRVPGAAFHTLTSGTAWLHQPGIPPVHLAPGDVVLLATGAEHALSSTLDADLVPFDHVAAEQAFETGNVMRVGHGDVQTRVLCASYRHDPGIATPLLTLLPDVLHIAAGSGHRGIDDTVRLLAVELSDPQLATPTVLNRLVDILLIQLIRSWVSSISREVEPSWLKGLGDPVVAAAMNAMHARPERAWTIESLAGDVAVSRATLARRFAASVGESPGAYLTRWRMDLAARALRDTDHPLEVIARSVGYTSEYAFSRAFSRARSVPPGRYRRQWQQMDARA
jgi:AraC-like DNA-binding protein